MEAPSSACLDAGRGSSQYLGVSTFTCDTGLVFTNKTAQFLYNSIVKKEGIERAEDAYSFGAAYNCVRNFEIEDIDNLYENDNYIRYHHGFGTFIRNNYVYPRSDLFSMADNGSCEIFRWIISIIKPQNIQKRKTESENTDKKEKIDLKGSKTP